VASATTCRHYATVGPSHTIAPSIEGMEDPEQLLFDLVECVPDANYVRLVFDVAGIHCSAAAQRKQQET
jgi:hypothetical protein